MKTLASYLITFCFCFCFIALPAFGQGQRVFHIGNSHTASTMEKGLEEMAVGEGYVDHDWDRHNIPGAALTWLWAHPPDGEGAKGRLDVVPGYDVLTLQSYNNTSETELEAARGFTGLALQGNPEVRVIMYTIWPAFTEDWENPSWGRDERWNEQLKAHLEETYPGLNVTVAPTSTIIREIGFAAEAGRIPGITSRFDLTRDIGHLNDIGAYAVCLTIYSMMYGEDPVGVSPAGWEDPALREPFDGVPPETAEAIQPLIRDILATYPPAGMDAGLISTTRRLPVAVEGLDYSVQLAAINNDGPVTWSVAEGSLPAGLTLSTEGLLNGSTSAVGNHPVTIRVADGSAQFDRQYELRVEPDVPPAIQAEPRLADIPCDQYFFEQLEVTGGVGLLTWEVAAGTMPNGMVLSPAGTLFGTPGEPGVFSFTVRVTDSHPVEPKSAEHVFFWKIGGKQPETLVVNRVKEGAITHDGVPDEPFWDWQPLNRAVAGSPTADARFALVYDVTSRGSINGIWVAVEVKNAGSTPAEGEGVDVYADALHNFEVIFNADDFHFFYPRDGQGDPLQLQGQRGRQHYKTWEVAQTEDGYTMEIKLGADGMFFGNGATLVPEALLVYGFNVGVRQGEGGEHRLLWRGTTEVDDDTSGFGSILLSQFPPSEGDLLGENLVEWRFLEGVTTAELDPTATRASAWLTGAPSLETGPGLRKVDREAASEDSFALFAPDNPERSEEDYVEFQVAPRQGAAISLTRLDLSLWTNREDEFFSAELRWSDDDFATSQAIPLSVANPIQFPTRREGYPITADLSGIEPLQGLQEPVTLRLYLWGANGSIIGLGRRNMMPDLLLLGTTHELTGDAAFEAEDAL